MSVHSQGYPAIIYSILPAMAEDYQSKKERWKRLRQNFPTPLQNIALSSVDAIASLQQTALLLLAEINDQIESLPKAILLLDIFPDIDKESLLGLVNAKGEISWQAIKSPAAEKRPVLQKPAQAFTEDILSLADHLQSFYAKMPRTAAESLASSNAMKDALNVVMAVRIARESTASDFVTLCLYGLFKESEKLLAEDIKANPSFLNAARQSDLWDQ
ncbi:MAG: hypothetical protein H8E29_00180 [Anaerolineales bacterium]|uniref:Uncharacterized protein n=1 Tax=Candidatus Desulfolinea nitratireducens TaxID=2841698 RepID=A0A8J6TGX3_9CHLR|nr:hypothetical protein [Candidatus Desulfolinea nitratireducens]